MCFNFMRIRAMIGLLLSRQAGCFRAAEAAWWHLISDEANGGRGIKPEDLVSLPRLWRT